MVSVDPNEAIAESPVNVNSLREIVEFDTWFERKTPFPPVWLNRQLVTWMLSAS